MVTAGGLLFIGGTNHDRKFHAFDKATGKLLWETTLPAAGNATAVTYEVNRRQYVVIAAGGTNRFRMIAHTAGKTADALVAFSLSGTEASPALPTDAALQKNSATTPRRQVPAAEQTPPDSLPEGDGKALVLHICTKCHGISVFAKLRMNRVGWANEVSSMVDKGASGTDVELKTIVDYLAANFK